MRYKLILATFLCVGLCVGLMGCVTQQDSSNAESQAQPISASLDTAVCTDFGPQTPRDISSKEGSNSVAFELAPPAADLNLCNIHTHTNAEHKGPGFSVFVGDGVNGGYACNDRTGVTPAMLSEPVDRQGAFEGVKPGDTIEVHWVFSSCDISPGPGLGSCLSDTCTDPLLRVEAQTFLVVNDADALNFMDFAYDDEQGAELHQPKTLPNNTGTPVLFRGSTTGPSYNQSKCSPLQVTWNVRPQCALLDINSLDNWAKSNNVFEETKSHGVRKLVTDPRLLSPID